ncbi:MAG: hypothetical protein HYS13_14155 [Planctomycetia bacterium]|nr:hypothetical protein [Planctomycetia bacterium]
MTSARPLRALSIVTTTALIFLTLATSALAQDAKKPAPKPANQRPAASEPTYPPRLPGGQEVVTDNSPDFLKAPDTLREGVAVAKTPPTVDFLFYPGQNYPGKPWSNWGDGLATGGKYYSAIGDHLAIGEKGGGEHGTGTAFVFEYEPQTQSLRQLVDVAKLLNLPEGHYTPGKIHSRLDLGSDGWLYFSTHRGSPRAANDANHYTGDWIIRCNPASGKAEVVAHGPVPKHSIPCSVLDPQRLIFYGGTAAGPDALDQSINFLAYDVKNKKVLYAGKNGPPRYLLFARSTGRVYFVAEKDEGPLMRFDPSSPGPPQAVGGEIGLRAATQETPQGFVYTVSTGQRSSDADLWSFNTKSEEIKKIGTAAASQAYVASIDADPAGRYLYYVPGAHGGSERDGSAVVQFDVKTGKKKVIAFLHPFYQEKYGLALKGTYSTAVSEAGDKLYITWNVSRGSRAWDSCGLTVVHIPESERVP